VTVLEARDRVGGRTLSEPMGPDQIVDVGGQWVGPPQKRVNSLLSKYGLALREQFEAAQHVLEDRGEVVHYSGPISALSVGPRELEATWAKLDAMVCLSVFLVSLALTPCFQADAVDVARPWTVCGANEQDSITLRNWLQKNVPEEASRKMVEWFARVCIAAEPSDYSLLYFLTWLKSGGLYASLVNIKGGAQNHTVVGGMQQLADAMRRELGAAVQLGCVVKKIVRKSGGVEVHVLRGGKSSEVVVARRVVLAMSPPLTNKIEVWNISCFLLLSSQLLSDGAGSELRAAAAVRSHGNGTGDQGAGGL
jgi:monoamine oxidase